MLATLHKDPYLSLPGKWTYGAGENQFSVLNTLTKFTCTEISCHSAVTEIFAVVMKYPSTAQNRAVTNFTVVYYLKSTVLIKIYINIYPIIQKSVSKMVPRAN